MTDRILGNSKKGYLISIQINQARIIKTLNETSILRVLHINYKVLYQ